MSFGHYSALIGILVAAVARQWRDIPRLWRKPTDWNAVRVQFGYAPSADRPISLPKRRNPILQFFLDLLPARNMDEYRRKLGYGPK